jgi:hypothetical protein
MSKQWCERCINTIDIIRSVNDGVSISQCFSHPELGPHQPLVAILIPSADGKRLQLFDELNHTIFLEGESPAPQFINQPVILKDWRVLSVPSSDASSGSSFVILCGDITSGATRNTDNSSSSHDFEFCSSTLSRMIDPTLVMADMSVTISKSSSVASLIEYRTTRDLHKKSNRPFPDSTGNDLISLHGVVVSISPIIVKETRKHGKNKEGDAAYNNDDDDNTGSFCFVELEDIAAVEEKIASKKHHNEEQSCRQQQQRLTLFLDSSMLIWRRFLTSGDEIIVTAVRRRASKIQLSDAKRKESLHCIYPLTTNHRTTNDDENKDKSNDSWWNNSAKNSVFIRVAKGVGPSNISYCGGETMNHTHRHRSKFSSLSSSSSSSASSSFSSSHHSLASSYATPLVDDFDSSLTKHDREDVNNNPLTFDSSLLGTNQRPEQRPLTSSSIHMKKYHHAPRVDESVVHYVATITGVSHQGHTTGGSEGILMKNAVHIYINIPHKNTYFQVVSISILKVISSYTNLF